ncbi:efflux transporter periplasmic adaptor subunit [Tabrizicola piscis]|uniref:Efflux transporter periplasmic adaptor subunit n=1 Tax=Tabrizicola piscis TaxID=2494374 RepID=A0A3S8U8K2_9RHOB|nr:efflux transporter periplasmic adaptor subunit [Tabrizicola piscis]AZL59941.1 efflux transporter periplasmic adaptor subunit [Tabrizicola piscis]
MRFLRRSLTGLFLLAVTLGLLGLAAVTVGNALRQSLSDDRPGRTPEERVVAANVLTLTPGTVTPQMTAFGKVEARRTLELRSRAGGTVVWVADSFRNGLAVTEGEVLVRLDPAPAAEALALAQAGLTEARAAADEAVAAVDLARDDLAAAEAQVELRRQALARQQDLAARGAGSSQAVETAELALSAADQSVLSRRQALASAIARVDQTAVAVTRAEIALTEAERGLADTELRAGLAGRVDGVTLVTGAVVGANEVFGRIVDLLALDVAVRLSTAQFGGLLGSDGALRDALVTVRPGGAGEVTLTGRLDRVGAAVGEGQTGRLVYVAMDAAPGVETLLQPGDFVSVSIEEAALPDAAVLPATALGRNGTLLALGAEDRLEEVAVDVLRRHGDDVIIRVGSLAGRDVVSERSAFLGDGIRIRPIRPQAAADVFLTPERRAVLMALVEASQSLAEAEKTALLRALEAETVPAEMIDRLERRMDG